jgi:hypothetical protein
MRKKLSNEVGNTNGYFGIEEMVFIQYKILETYTTYFVAS